MFVLVSRSTLATLLTTVWRYSLGDHTSRGKEQVGPKRNQRSGEQSQGGGTLGPEALLWVVCAKNQPVLLMADHARQHSGDLKLGTQDYVR